MDPLRVGIVGAGAIAGEHISTLTRLGGTSIVAVCDLDEERARDTADAASASAYTSLEELLEREPLDAVWVCTPPLAHRGPAVAALERGLHLYLEKPIARTFEDAAAIVAAAERSGAVCAVGYQWHGLELLDDVRDALAGQGLGLLAGRSFGPADARAWFVDRAQGGGNILERASHHIGLQRVLAGEVASVQGAAAAALGPAEEAGGDIEDAAALVLHFAAGGLGTIQVAWTRKGLPAVHSLDVLASETTLQLALDPDFTLQGVSRRHDLRASARRHPFERTVARFLEAARERDPGRVFCTPADAAATLAVALACEEALASGGTVAVSEPSLARSSATVPHTAARSRPYALPSAPE